MRSNIIDVHMSNMDNITSYLMRLTQIHDQLVDIGETMLDVELVNAALNGFPKSWHQFIMGFVS